MLLLVTTSDASSPDLPLESQDATATSFRHVYDLINSTSARQLAAALGLFAVLLPWFQQEPVSVLTIQEPSGIAFYASLTAGFGLVYVFGAFLYFMGMVTCAVNRPMLSLGILSAIAGLVLIISVRPDAYVLGIGYYVAWASVVGVILSTRFFGKIWSGLAAH